LDQHVFVISKFQRKLRPFDHGTVDPLGFPYIRQTKARFGGEIQRQSESLCPSSHKTLQDDDSPAFADDSLHSILGVRLIGRLLKNAIFPAIPLAGRVDLCWGFFLNLPGFSAKR
jgi:hypothetical protein